MPLPLWHPARLLALWFDSGRLPGAPGTWGSLAALPFAALLAWHGGQVLLFAAALAIIPIGIWASGRYATACGREDPKEVVIDEVAGQWLTLAALPLDPLLYGIGFLAFRLFDITKPWPVNLADRRVGGGLGIMLDDVIAAAYAAALCYGLTILTGRA
jgi:phosphatidylglycerophosphatase A